MQTTIVMNQREIEKIIAAHVARVRGVQPEVEIEVTENPYGDAIGRTVGGPIVLAHVRLPSEELVEVDLGDLAVRTP